MDDVQKVLWVQQVEREIVRCYKLTGEFHSYLSEYVVVLFRNWTLCLIRVQEHQCTITSEVKIEEDSQKLETNYFVSINEQGSLIVITNMCHKYFILRLEYKKGQVKVKKTMEEYNF